jgi:hypothetical protein
MIWDTLIPTDFFCVQKLWVSLAQERRGAILHRSLLAIQKTKYCTAIVLASEMK